MPLNFKWAPSARTNIWEGETITIGSAEVPVIYRRNERAKRYRLTLGRDGCPRVTIPRRGSHKAAVAFATAHREWLSRQLLHFQTKQRDKVWTSGSLIWFRGHQWPLELEENQCGWLLRLGSETVPLAVLAPLATDLRPEIEFHLKRLAITELPARTQELARIHSVHPRFVTVRAQVSRWGSCSRRGTISLNWRLVQVPETVRDYVIVHELMHLRQMNHSPRFWALIAAAYPDFKKSEAWLREHSQALL